jgi:hypothetical protein
MPIKFLNTLQVDSDVLYVDASSNKVGIGTTSPEHKLHVISSEQCPALFQSSVSGGGISLMDSTTADDTRVGIGAFGDHLCFRSGGAPAGNMRLTSDGDLGIGLTNPNAKLDVDGTTNSTYFTTGGAEIYGDIFSGLNLRCPSGIANDFSLVGSAGIGPNIMTVPAATTNVIFYGNVGIGTTNTLSPLTIQGNDNKDTGPVLTLIGSGTNQVESGRIRFRESNTHYQGGFIHYNGSSNTLNIGVHDATDSLTSSDNNAISILRSNGNVGIGTAPSEKLQVSGNIKLSETAATTDTDKFVVLDSGVLKYRTGSQVLSDIGAQSALTNPVTGTGTTNYLPKFTGSTSLGNSLVYDDGTSIAIGEIGTSGSIFLARSSDGALAGNIAIDPNSVANFKSSHLGGGGYFSWHTNVGGGVGERMRLQNSGNLGIGTTNPASKLHAYESSSNTDPTAGITVEQAGSGDAVVQYLLSFQKRWVTGIDNSDSDKFKISQDSDLGLNTVMTFDSSSRVGIGTTTPDNKLEVVGDDNDFGLKVTRGNATSQYLLLRGYQMLGQGNHLLLSADNTKQVWLGHETTTTELVIDVGGNVGIGTASPDRKLHIYGGNSGVTGYPLATGLDIEGSGSHTGINILSRDTGAGRIYFGSPSSYIAGSIEYNHNASVTSGHMLFRSGNAERMRLTGTGNLGIGTTSPQTKLHVANGTLRTWSPTSGTTAIFESTASSRSFVTITGANESELWFGDGTTQAKGRVRYENNNNRMQLWVNGSPRINISSNGNVGIGNANDTYKLDVSGTGRFTGITTVGNQLYVQGQAADGYQANVTIKSDNTGGWDRPYLKMESNAGDNFSTQYKVDSGQFNTLYNDSVLFTIKNNGNVGIGTNSPGYKLDVAGEGKVLSKFRVGGAVMLAEPGTGVLQFGSEGGSSTAIYSASLERIRINSSGNVGIGTTAPSVRLDVVSSSSGTYSNALKLHNASDSVNTATGIRLQTAASTSANSYSEIRGVRTNFPINGGHALTFHTTATTSGSAYERMRIDGAGNVGIATISPSYRLDVSGNARVTGDFRCDTLIQTSDADLKDNIRDISKDKSNIRFKEYTLKNDTSGKKKYGVLADDIRNDYPELVHYNAEGQAGVDYISLLVKKVAELEASEKTMLTWRHYIGNTSYNTLYDSGATTAFPYAYSSIPAPYDMYLTSVTIVNNPYSTYNKGPLGGKAQLLAYENGKFIDKVADVNYNQEPYASVTFDFADKVLIKQGNALQLRFQADGNWYYCNSTIILTKA